MKDLKLNFKFKRLTGNCGVEYAWFDTHDGRDPMTALVKQNYHNNQNRLPGTVIFSGNKGQNRARTSGPHRFKDWLVEQGENVLETPWADNVNMRKKGAIKTYVWVPSEAFVAKYDELKKPIMKAEREKALKKYNAEVARYGYSYVYVPPAVR